MQAKQRPRPSKNLARLSVFAALAMFVLVCGSACQPIPPMDGNPPLDSGPASFADDIQPILTASCIRCHSPGGAAFEGNGIPMNLTDGNAYDAIVGEPSVQNANLTLVVPGDAENSLLDLKVSLNTPPVGVRMPRFAAQLSESAIAQIERWINEGALDN